MNKTKVINDYINTIDYSIVAGSYKWEDPRCKNTFPADLWIGAIKDLLYFGLSVKDIESKYVQFMPRVNKTSNMMYVNSLLKKMRISNQQNSEKIQLEFSEEEVEKWTIQWIKNITKEHYENSVNKARKIIDQWNTYIEHQEKDIIKLTKEDKSDYIQNHKNREIEWTESIIPNGINLEKVKLNKVNNLISVNDKVKEEIGQIGESIFYSQLVKKYGFDKVEWSSRDINKFSPYDFKVILDNEELFFEVKSTTANIAKFFLSRNEYEFWKINKRKYRLIVIKNIMPSLKDTYGIIEEVKEPQIEVDMDNYGTKNGKIIISPSNFRGLI